MTSLMMISSVSICTATNRRRPGLISYKAFRKLARQLWLWMARQQNHLTDRLSVVALPPFFKPLGLTRLDASKFISLFFWWLSGRTVWKAERCYDEDDTHDWPLAVSSRPLDSFWRLNHGALGPVLYAISQLLKIFQRWRIGTRTAHSTLFVWTANDFFWRFWVPFSFPYWTVCFSSAWIFPWNVSGSFLELFFGVFPIIMLASSLSYLRTPYLYLLSWFLLKTCCPRYDLTWLRGSCSLWAVFLYPILGIGTGRF